MGDSTRTAGRWLIRGGAGLLLLGAAAGAALKMAEDRPVAGTWAVDREWTMSVNGVPEHLWLRGRRADLPLLLVLHGGPGGSEMALFRHFVPALEEHFLVAHWDQPGAGRSNTLAAYARPLDMPVILADLDVVATAVLRMTGRQRLVLLGHSWGSALAFLYAQQHPGKVALVAGTGQAADMPAGEAASYAFALRQAREQGDARAVQALTKAGPPPHDVQRMLVSRHWATHYGAALHGQRTQAGLLWGMLRRPEVHLTDAWRAYAGNMRSLKLMWPAFSQLNLRRSVPTLDVPVLMLLGRHDQILPSSIAAAYFAELSAPGKRLVWFERAAHNVPFEQPQDFVAALVEGHAALVKQKRQASLLAVDGESAPVNRGFRAPG